MLIGAHTLALVAAAVEVGEERLLELKGKSEPVAAHPLLAVREVAERSHASRFVGRERELQQLVDTCDRALAGARCELITVVGDPGVGKSRLVAEALAQVDARVVRGRCLSYGEGITYWPVVEVVKQLDALPSDEAGANAIRSLLGEGETISGTDEIAWAFRKLLEEQAPLVVCFDDIQWGEETFLDLVESTALLSTGAPLLLVCMARPELLDRRPGWPATLRLEPLRAEQAGELSARPSRTICASGSCALPAATRSSSRRCSRSARRRRRRRGARDAARPAGGATRPARRAGAEAARAGSRRGRALPPRRGAGARTGRDGGDAAAGGARSPRPRPPRPARSAGRGRVPLPPSLDPRRRLRRGSARARRATRRSARAARPASPSAARRRRRRGSGGGGSGSRPRPAAAPGRDGSAPGARAPPAAASPRAPPGERLDGAAVEDLALDRAPLEHRALRPVELVEAGREQRAQRRRDLDALRLARPSRASR